MSELTFYTNPMSRGRIVRWMLEEVGVPYKTEILGFGNMKSAAYKAVNPMGKVPAIKHGDTVITECAAICAYLADAFPGANLAPPPKNRGLYYRWLFFAAGPLEMGVSTRSMGLTIPADRMRMAGCGSYDDLMSTLEYAVSENRFVAGDQFTAADVYVGSHIAWGLQFGSIETRQHFVDYLALLSERPACQRAQQLDDAAAKELQATG